jgi:hypothetical protein
MTVCSRWWTLFKWLPLGKFEKTRNALKFSETLPLLVYANDVNLLGGDMNTTNKNRKTLLEASKADSLEVNVKKTKYTLTSCHQNAGQNCSIRIANWTFENLAKFEYLGTTVTDQNLIHKEIKSKLNLTDA